MAAEGMLERPRRPSLIRHVVEDDRPESGHLQVCCPSPISGLFEPAVKLGDKVVAGEIIGRVTDSVGQQSTPVESTQEGIILCLRAFARVDQGDSLAVVLELEPTSGDQA